jgi:glyoxylase-like metal-dependent hydrolase (beta-lactamase superfamily II)
MPDIESADRTLPVYPFEAPPLTGQTLEVVTGVHWIRMPLSPPLNHINLWLLDDGAGWAAVDTGMRDEVTVRTWAGLCDGPLAGRPLTRVFVTHMHPDHVGMAGWLSRKFSVRLWMTRQEYMACRVMMSDTGREAPAVAIQFFQQAGWPAAAIETYRARFGNFGKHIHALPDSFRRLQDGEDIRIGAYTWRVVVGNGHSPEHACLHCPALKLLISGDQILPRISSNVSVNPIEPDANPISDWLASLAKIRREVPDDVLVLPAHGECFHGLHARVAALERKELAALQRLRRALAEPRRVVDTFGALFARAVSVDEMAVLGMATGEAVACLNYLMQRGEVTRAVDPTGVAWYRLAAA